MRTTFEPHKASTDQPFFLMKIMVSIFSICFLMAIPSTGNALCDVIMQWDANAIAPDGYRLFAREKDQASYGTMKWEGAETSGTISDLEEGKTYYSVVRAYVGEEESGNSNEVKYTFTEECKVIVQSFPWTLIVPVIGEKSKNSSKSL